MTPRTRFLSTLIGLYCIIVAIAMATRRQAALDAIIGILHNGSMMFILGLVISCAGLAMVLGHNLWSGGAVTVLVTVVGWITLAKGVLLLLVSPEAETGLVLNTLHYERLFYLYVSISFFLGAFLAYAGFASPAPSGNVAPVPGQPSSAHHSKGSR